ncbi:MAG: hypothetical protein COZ06_14190 [Armatimonadetes bacterium CG_4_10_14_3_um_filter_66_18]|nr:MAG: hypothetical protein AUJ96_17640 [Armatimonadetes bacterium CG2_30_66_41]PIU91312.1 MAG: hypothetical protein COS65_22340 [Armatimonadetes bacterium CG06_land_8_20_14_3_00_66_21]PIX42959.1 MAG: hypothetical protein COZ57_20335 [Armatimonadetes bacterium CG_4_8_14_3_um_filter_66_20]PIY49426.1 MAG: hypothetical protein COZ06_14190 [Armatimonadetes bacterium CG_4_10_14_3_um_filter_66_18]PIZ38457.1 MAG: hypothetical protein COY42_23120 [Armatimonadetes bacterium CG_4_10_14_0_8_um_filter_66_
MKAIADSRAFWGWMAVAGLVLPFVLASVPAGAQEDSMTTRAHRTDWMAEGSFGLMVHYLVSPPGESHAERAPALNGIVNGFDVDGFVEQLASTGADWLIFTLGQNTGYYNSPNKWLDARLPGHTPDRDLVLEIAVRLHALGKRFIAYLPAETAAQRQAIHEVFAWNPRDQHEFQRRYREFLRAYSLKFGRLCDGWWFDGCYEWDVFHNSLYEWPEWIAAAKAGNPDALVAFNDGSFCINKVKPVTPLEDYHAGEVHLLVGGKIQLGHDANSPLYLPDARFIDGVQWHALVPVDSTFEGGEPHHYADEELLGFLKACKSVGGAVTLNLPVSMGGVIPEESVEQMRRLGQALQ